MIYEHPEHWFSRNRGIGGARFIGGISAATAIGIGGLAIGAAGVGMSAYSTFAQGGTQAGIAGQNAQIARMNAELDKRSAIILAENEINAAKVDKLNAGLTLRSGQIDESNARLERVQGDFIAATQIENFTTDAKLARMDSETFRRNATTLTSYARTIEATGRERISRMREEGRRAMGIVRNRVAKSGVVMEGSPLIVAGENAANIELAAQDVNFETRTASRNTELAAQDELSKARRSILQMRQSTRNARTAAKSVSFTRAASDLKIAGAKITQEAAGYASDAADFRASQGGKLIDLANDRYDVALGEADIIKAGGAATERASQLAAYGTLLSGGADVAGQAADLVPKPGPKPPSPSANTGGGD